MNKNEIYLSDLVYSLENSHVKLNLNFLNKLLQNASKSGIPYKNLKFANKITCRINKTKNSALTIKG